MSLIHITTHSNTYSTYYLKHTLYLTPKSLTQTLSVCYFCIKYSYSMSIWIKYFVTLLVIFPYCSLLQFPLSSPHLFSSTWFIRCGVADSQTNELPIFLHLVASDNWWQFCYNESSCRLLSEAALRMRCSPTQCVADGVCMSACAFMYLTPTCSNGPQMWFWH